MPRNMQWAGHFERRMNVDYEELESKWMMALAEVKVKDKRIAELEAKVKSHEGNIRMRAEHVERLQAQFAEHEKEIDELKCACEDHCLNQCEGDARDACYSCQIQLKSKEADK